MGPSLLDFVASALSSLPGKHDYAVEVLRSQPRRAHALFPHAVNLKTKVWQEEVLVLLKEREPEREGDSPTARVPVVALEASVYTIPSTSTSLVYISKVDTSGLASTSPSPARTLVAAFVSYYLDHPPHATRRVRIHIFARAQGQYLFPGSIENEAKHVLDDKGLIRWWKATIALAASRLAPPPTADAPSSPPVQLFYLIPGLTYLESLPYVPDSPSTSSPPWTYGHPYSTIPSPLHRSSSPTASTAPLSDLIPNFPDDPKARFIASLTSSAVAPAGSPDDYDDLVLSLSTRTFNAGIVSTSAVDALNRERAKERDRLIGGCEGGVEEWWERMAFRQECCSGILVAFFVVARDGEDSEPPAGGGVKPERAAVGHATFTRLWSQFHNVDYARTGIEKCRAAADKWERDVELVVRAEGYAPREGTEQEQEKEDEEVKRERRQEVYGLEVFRAVVVDNAAPETKKREAKPVAKVNVMVPRKKVKKV